jgi:hypothetical protein
MSLPKRLRRLRDPIYKPPRPRPVAPSGRTGAAVKWTPTEQRALNKAFARGDRITVANMMKEKTNGP